VAVTGEQGETRAKLDRRILIVFPGLMLAMMLAALDSTIVATSLPTIVTDLGGLTHISWVATAYLLTSCVSTPIYGKLGDQFGRKRLFQFAIVLFLIGSALCGMAQTMTELVIFRGLQGIGAGGLMVNSQAVIGDLVAPADRGRYQGFMQSVFALATVAGPLVGGVLTQDASWRWVFYVNLPIGAIALAVIGLVLKLPPRTGPKPRIDWSGAALLTVGVAALILLTSSGGQAFAWLSPQAVLLVVLAVGTLVAFVFVERRAPEPLFPLRLFRNPIIRITGPLIFVVGFGMLGITTFMPLYQQIVDGVSPTMSGLRLAPLMLSMMVTSVACGQTIARIGKYRIFPRIGSALLVIGTILLSQLALNTSYGYQFLALAVVGVALGMINPVMVLATQNAVEARDIGVATSVNTFGRTVGSSFGVAVFGAIFAAKLTASLQQRLPGKVVSQFSASGINISRAQIDALPAALRADFLGGFANALHDVFLGGIVVAVIGFLLATRLREVPLRRRRGSVTKTDEPLKETPRA
jgi:EmrB/QacA subfamily drug resistance transporter